MARKASTTPSTTPSTTDAVDVAMERAGDDQAARTDELPGALNKMEVAFMQIPHGRHQTDGLPARPPDPGQTLHSLDHGHRSHSGKVGQGSGKWQ